MAQTNESQEQVTVNVETLQPVTRTLMTIGALPTSYLISMTYEEQLLWLQNYLIKTVIPAINNNAEATQEVQDIVMALQDYINDYFNNLDVQEEINNKLDELVEDGTLTNIISTYVQPLINAQNQEISSFKTQVNGQIAQQNQEISSFKTQVNGQIAQQNAQIQAVTSGSPLVASNVAGMTDTTRVYVNTTDGNWYYYNGSSWVSGGVYQSTQIDDGSVNYNSLSTDLKNSFKSSYLIGNELFYNNFPVILTDNIEWKDGYYLNASGQEVQTSGFSVAYFNVDAGDLIVTDKKMTSSANARHYCFYQNNNFISYLTDNLTQSNGNFITPNTCNKLGICMSTANKNILLEKYHKQVIKNYNNDDIYPNGFILPLNKSIKRITNKDDCTLILDKYYNDNFELLSTAGYATVLITNVSYDKYYLIKGHGYNNPATIRFFDSNDNILYKSSNFNTDIDEIFKLPTNILNIDKIVITYLKNHAYDYGEVTNFNCLSSYDISNKVIYCAGDSLTVGENGASNSYVNYLSTFYFGSVVENRGHNGWTAAGLLPELCNMPDKQNYYGPPSTQTDYANASAVIINMGTNGGVTGSIETSIPQIANATDLSGNPLSFMTVENAIAEGGFKYNNEVIDSAEKYWNLFADTWYGNVALTIEYVQWQNPKTQIFLLPPCISTISASSNNSAETIGNAMKELCELYGITFIDINNSIGINRRNASKYCIDYVHGTNQRNEMVGKYVARYISNKIYE